MARREVQREDLLAEATALVERAEFQIAEESAPVVIGFRRNGAASVYFGQDIAYQFNAANQLRRAFVDDRLFKADRGRLASLVRLRTEDEVQLVRYDLDPAEMDAIMGQMGVRIARLRDEILSGKAKVLRQVPEASGVTARIANWLRQLSDPLEIARSPRVGS
jgi:hypothetical protein